MSTSNTGSVKFKVVLIGNPMVGKSSLRRAYLGENFTSNYIETIGSDFSFKSIRHESGRVLNIAIWDLAGQVEYKSTHPLYYKGALGALVVYSVTDRNSFLDIPNWIKEFYKGVGKSDTPLLIIGNKIDLIHDDSEVISVEEENDMMKRIKDIYPNISLNSIRTSAKEGKNVGEAFKSFTNQILDWIDTKTSNGENQTPITKQLSKNFPSAILMTMNQQTGPVIVAYSPPISTFKENEINSIKTHVIKLISSLDFEDIVFHSNVMGDYPWTTPKGSMKYIAFVLENKKARGQKELFIIGLNINRELSSIIDGLKGIINGYLHGVMNKFARLHTKNRLNFVVSRFKYGDKIENLEELESLLLNLRVKSENAIEQWYNLR